MPCRINFVHQCCFRHGSSCQKSIMSQLYVTSSPNSSVRISRGFNLFPLNSALLYSTLLYLKARSCQKKKQRRKGKIYPHFNAQFQRIARRDKKAFLSDQSKEIEENNRMGKTRSLQENEIPKGHFMQRWAQ